MEIVDTEKRIQDLKHFLLFKLGFKQIAIAEHTKAIYRLWKTNNIMIDITINYKTEIASVNYYKLTQHTFEYPFDLYASRENAYKNFKRSIKSLILY